MKSAFGTAPPVISTWPRLRPRKDTSLKN